MLASRLNDISESSLKIGYDDVIAESTMTRMRSRTFKRIIRKQTGNITSGRSIGHHQLVELVVIDPTTAVGVDVGDHVVDIGFGQIVAEVLQDPP